MATKDKAAESEVSARAEAINASKPSLKSYKVMGIEVKVDKRALSDVITFRLLRDCIRAGNDLNEQLKLCDLFERLLGAEQSQEVLEKLMDDGGFVDIVRLGSFIGELFSVAALKN
jgi:hypothetical protein